MQLPLHELISTLSTSQLNAVADFIKCIKTRDDSEATGKSSTDFWNNKIDDEVWNNA
jgi:hypothetical protein